MERRRGWCGAQLLGIRRLRRLRRLGNKKTHLRNLRTHSQRGWILSHSNSRIELGFVRLLARANEIIDGFGGFGALPLLEFTHPARDGIDHIAGGLTRGLYIGRLSVSTFGALYNFYCFFL